MTSKFKVGDRVRLKKSTNPDEIYDGYCSTGVHNREYEVIEIKEDETDERMNIFLKGSNWHKGEWLEHIIVPNVIGGAIV